MRFLFVGAGAVGGYFGGRLSEKGADVTFLVRERRKRQLQERGLTIRSIHGDFHTQPKLITAGEKAEPFDCIVLSVKAYHLDTVLDSIAPYVDERTVILPLLNGIAHIEALFDRFGRERVLGGLCFIETTLNEQGEVEQYSPRHDIVFGEWNGRVSERVKAMLREMEGSKMQVRVSDHIVQEMWNKYAFIATFSGMTALMRTTVGGVTAAPFGKELFRRLLNEVVSVARSIEPSLPEEMEEKIWRVIEAQGPQMKSSLSRDIEKGLPTETDHLHGYLIRNAPADLDLPLLKTVYSHVKAYEADREKTLAR
ncbi:ketopantoate reductase family protein [Polycladomyces sp. WAk]|uniref:2-dehydropantoate 2-reductase n=1 Tax=Polycladomyces zharkentensis TaxID=2807616 RepID=A0ABS2WML6_9BACL|nr:ketopantoate reductase family protein [Polycladomyces sp. WAk]MBN2910718.1 ketopantoate reductase family protein [Polycladomyces sp. WAk]